MSPASHMTSRLRKLYGIVWNRMRCLNERRMHPLVGRTGTASRSVLEELEPRLLLFGQGFDFPGEVPPEYAVGSYPSSVAAADFDGDGAVDLVTANSLSNTVSVLRNLGNGTFAAQATYPVGSYPRSVAAADFDGDGAVDLVTANYTSDTVSVLRNLGNGRSRRRRPTRW